MVVLGEINTQNAGAFHKTISGGKPTLVLFHAEWCGHCQMFKPEWSKIVSELSNQHGLNIAQVEHGNYGLIPEHLRMNAFPTIQIIRFGHPTASFMGTRTLSNVVKFAKQHAEKKVATKKKVEPKSVLKDKKKKRPIHAIGERRRKRVV